ncbi:cyclic nucleotide-gated ion channel 4 [Cucumis melo var. makuwa]|uniref:Cyclic nucleotide-gated ion channel 4 n=1 Tax=Cucumis melo var. makuwa TaxID=1194695 RepID=A0A5A7TVH4_CUCMM|nr:cyclic nucleotide-gated ion channel 4 [Cucumis melo var. makuwa]TYK03268.1 cyclic nucleotide-gated ion channel 4 [Cucumis melo var. makuwa]
MATTSQTSDDEELEHDESEEEEDEEEHSNAAFCQSLYGVGSVLDPTTKWVREWNWVFLLVCAAGLFVDPLFLYTLSISESWMCVFIDGWLAITVTVLRCMGDALHLWNIWVQLKTATKSSFAAGRGEGDARDENRGLRDSSPRAVALRYLKSKKGFFFDLFVILPFPQVLFLPYPHASK